MAGFVVFAVPFAAYTGLVLHQFYVKGSFLQDAGWFAFVMAASDLRLPNPQSLGGGSFFAVHVAPIFLLAALLKQALTVSATKFFAGFIGFCHALPGVGVFWALRSGFGLRGPVATAIASIVAIAFSFNGLSLAIARYPHVEILVVGGAILFLVALVERQLVLAGLAFALALATREDAGFHLFAILFVLIALNRWYGVGWHAQRAEIAFAAVALTYSLAALAVQLAVATGPSAFMRIYLGDPSFASLTPAVVLERLLGYVAYRTYLVLPALIAAIWAAHTRNPYILVGYIAFVPWGLLHLIAHSDIAGTLSGYYAYPFMIASFWPLVGVLIERRRRAAPAVSGPRDAALPVLAFVAMTLATFAAIGQQHNPGRLYLAQAFLGPPAAARQASTDHAVAQLVRSKTLLGAVIVDGSVVALAPDGFTWGETVLGHRLERSSTRPDIVAYFAQGYEAEAARRLAASSGVARHYRILGTSLRLAADRPIPAAAPLAALLVPADPPD